MRSLNKTLSILFTIPILLIGCNNSQDSSISSAKNNPSIQNSSKKPVFRTVTAPSGLKLRTAPHTKATVRNLIPPKTKVQILSVAPSRVSIGGRQGQWYKIAWTPTGEKKVRIGWVFGGWLK